MHSGWDLPFCPPPADHFLHHVQYGKNLALGYTLLPCARAALMELTREFCRPCDAAFKTYQSGNEARFKYGG